MSVSVRYKLKLDLQQNNRREYSQGTYTSGGADWRNAVATVTKSKASTRLVSKRSGINLTQMSERWMARRHWSHRLSMMMSQQHRGWRQGKTPHANLSHLRCSRIKHRHRSIQIDPVFSTQTSTVWPWQPMDRGQPRSSDRDRTPSHQGNWMRDRTWLVILRLPPQCK